MCILDIRDIVKQRVAAVAYCKGTVRVVADRVLCDIGYCHVCAHCLQVKAGVVVRKWAGCKRRRIGHRSPFSHPEMSLIHSETITHVCVYE